MNSLYRFSPITDKVIFQEALEYITEQLESLSQKVLGEKLPISILKIFPHYLDEYGCLYKIIETEGPKSEISSDKNLYVEVNKIINENKINYFVIRIVDPYRFQVGCGDYEVDEFAEFRKKHINSPYVRDAKDTEEMLEVWHPDFDVLGYVIPKM